MASAKEIKNHIASVKNTQKITSAMYLIASTKLRRARESLSRTQPFFNALRTEIARALQSAEDGKSPYVAEPSEEREDGVNAYLVITADRGLAGAYNQNVIKEVQHLLRQQAQSRLLVVGDYGRQFFLTRGVEIERDFLYSAQEPTVSCAREIGARLLDLYDRGEIGRLYVVYTEMHGMTQRVRTEKLLPIDRAQFDGTERELVFEPSADAVLAHAIPGYVTGYLYSVLVESFCAEQSARASAMDAASDNADELVRALTAEYNHERQSAITQEITEVSAGARAKKQHKKEVRSGV